MAKARDKRDLAHDVDWPLLEGAMAIRPRVVESRAGRTESVLLLSRKIAKEPTLMAMGTAFLDGLRNVVSLDRVALYVVSTRRKTLTGVVGTSLEGKLVDERHLRHAVDPTDEMLWSDLLEGKRSFEHKEDAPWVAHSGEETRVVGRGWFVRTPLATEEGPLGFLYNDSAITRAPFDRERQELAATLGMLVAPHLASVRNRSHPSTENVSKFVSECLEFIERSPSSTNGELARHLGLSPRRLSADFKSETGTSLLNYRTESRLTRFFELAEKSERDEDPASLLDLALAAGFGSYSQFHRIFSARYGCAPTRHFAREGGEQK